jgi:type II secretory ATPase GspE/PulE/Tfp pilus assembly ATPase PilB-like protein
MKEYAGDTGIDAGKFFKKLRADKRITMYRANGCAECDRTGYKGRMGLYELMVADPTVKRLIQTRAPVTEIVAAATAGGMRTLKQDGIAKVLQGLTDIAQVRGV